MPFYKKRPVIIDANAWLGGAEEATKIIDWALAFGGTIRYHERLSDGDKISPEFLAIDTLEGTMKASPGDYIIRGVEGEFYPCKPGIFHKTYERV